MGQREVSREWKIHGTVWKSIYSTLQIVIWNQIIVDREIYTTKCSYNKKRKSLINHVSFHCKKQEEEKLNLLQNRGNNNDKKPEVKEIENRKPIWKNQWFFCKEQENGQISSNTGKKKIENTNYWCEWDRAYHQNRHQKDYM